MELPPDERRHIQNLSVIPGAVVVYVGLAYFVITIRQQQTFLISYWVAYFGALYIIALPLTMLLCEEILRHRKLRKSSRYYTKRLFRRMALVLAGAALYALVFGTVLSIPVSALSEQIRLIVAGSVWFLAWGVLIFLLRKKLALWTE